MVAWIRTVSEHDAEGDLGRLYSEVADPITGKVDHVLRVHSLHPEGLDAHFKVYKAAMAGTRSLRRVEREMIALVVSSINGCHY